MSAEAPPQDPRELAERESKPVAAAWIERALWALGQPDAELTRAGLRVNFAGRRVPERVYAQRIAKIRETYLRVRAVIGDSARRFASVSEREARELFPGGALPPAYALFGDRIFFTPAFAPFDPGTARGLGPKCRAAMVLHEAVHVVDERSGEPEVHVSEWDEPRFSRLSPDQSLHNPSSYASFAAQMHEGLLEWPAHLRFGAGNLAV
jgi:hypothetical protein